MKSIKRAAAALALCLALLLAGCAKAPELTPVWQNEAEADAPRLVVSNCTIQQEQTVDFWAQTDGITASAPAQEVTLLQVQGTPLLQITGAQAAEVTLRFATPYETGYRDHFEAPPSNKIDYTLTTMEDGALQYTLDTFYTYWITVKTKTGESQLLISREKA